MNLLKSLFTISSMTLLSRILGFARDAIIARTFGASIMSDVFFVAFKIPNLFRRFFAEGTFSQAFIPILIEFKNQKKHDIIRIFISHVSGMLIFILIIVTMIGILCAPWIIIIIAPGFINIPEEWYLATSLLRIIFPYILIISLSALASAILNSWNNFLVPAFSPTFLNISMISSTILLTSIFHPPIISLAWSVLIGGLLQLIYQLLYLKKINMLVLPIIQFKDRNVWKIFNKMSSSILGVSISQISLIINTIFASYLASGSISWIYYADRLIEFPIGVLGIALGTVLLPLLSKSFITQNYNEYSKLLDWGLRLCFLLSLPSAVGLAILSYPLIVTLFQYGKFSDFHTLMTQQTLISYSIGLVGLILVKILAFGFYSRQDMYTPMYISIITLIITQLMNIILITPLQHVGLSLSISLASYFNSGLLYWKLRSKKLFYPKPGWLYFLYRLILSVIIMAIILVMLLLICPEWTQDNMIFRLFRLITIVIIGIITYLSSLWIMGFRIHHFIYRL